MKKGISCLLVIVCSLSVAAQSMPYSLAAISESLKSNAAIITHLENIEVDVEGVDKVTLNVHKIFTVVNEEGKDALWFSEYSSRMASLESAEIRVYDKAGKQVGKYKKRDMATVAVGEGLVPDGIMTYYRVQPSSYPVTVEVDYEQKIKSTLLFPDYRYIHAKEAVVESNYTVNVPSDITLRYKARHCAITPVITDAGKYKTYKWTVQNLPAAEEETSTVSERDKYPYVSIVADQFSYYGHPGDISSWKSFGGWMDDLYKGLDELPAERQQFFQQLVSDASTDTEKVRRIYQYLQENFRYVSIQLGIGGLQPFSAEFTDQKKYGDCKALSNFMKAALKAVGIKSYVAIINSDYNEEPVDPDFPANTFNHVILCVPQKSDSIWLECTSATAEFGKLGTFTENRNALLITEKGGVLVPTPKSVSATNVFYTHTTVNMEADLTAVANTTLMTKGAYREQVADLLKQKKDDQKEALVYGLGYKQPDYFELASEKTEPDPQTELKMELRQLPEFNSGTKYFIKPRIGKMWSNKLPTAENRKQDFYFHFPFQKQDTTVIKLPAGFKIDVLPSAKELHSAYGAYRSKYWYNDAEHAVYSVTTLVLNNHKIPAADYRAVKVFFDEVLQDDTQRIVIIKTADTPTPPKAF